MGCFVKVENFKELIPQALLFYTLVQPKRARTRSEGGIILAQSTQQTEQFVTTVGQIVNRGALTYKAKTPGLDYSQDPNEPAVGDWVLYQKNSGLKVSFAFDKSKPIDDPENRLDFVVMTDTDLLLKLTELQVEQLIGWVQ